MLSMPACVAVIGMATVTCSLCAIAMGSLDIKLGSDCSCAPGRYPHSSPEPRHLHASAFQRDLPWLMHRAVNKDIIIC